MEVTLDLLHVALEDRAAGSETRLVRSLTSSGYLVNLLRVDSPELLGQRLAEDPTLPDLLITDPIRDHRRCEQLLADLQARVGDALPAIVISAGLGEEAAVRLMRAGARDVVPEHEASHLLAAVERELAEARVRRAAAASLSAASRRADELGRLFELAARGLEGESPASIIEAVLDFGAEQLGAIVSFFANSGGSVLQLTITASRGLEGVPARHRRILPLAPSALARRVVESEGPLAMADLREEGAWEAPALFSEVGVVSGLFMRVGASDGCGLGMLGFGWDLPRMPSSEDVDLIASLARVASGAIGRAHVRDPAVLAARECSGPDERTLPLALRDPREEGAVRSPSPPRVRARVAPAPRDEMRDDGMAREHEGARIVVVDDDAAVARVARRLLERLGYRVTVFSCGARALAFVRDQPDGADLVITDYGMPDLDGLALMKALHALVPDLAVVLTSGDPSRLVTTGEPGQRVPSHVLSKPFRRRELTTLVTGILPLEGRADEQPASPDGASPPVRRAR